MWLSCYSSSFVGIPCCKCVTFSDILFHNKILKLVHHVVNLAKVDQAIYDGLLKPFYFYAILPVIYELVLVNTLKTICTDRALFCWFCMTNMN